RSIRFANLTFVVCELLTDKRRQSAVCIDLARGYSLRLVLEALTRGDTLASLFHYALLLRPARCAHRCLPYVYSSRDSLASGLRRTVQFVNVSEYPQRFTCAKYSVRCDGIAQYAAMIPLRC